MKKIIGFSKLFLPATVLSVILIILGIAGYIFKGGFNLGVDFQAGLLQEIQFVPTALKLNYSGRGNASVSLTRGGLYVVVSGAGADEETYSFPFASYGTLGELVRGLGEVEGIGIEAVADEGTGSSWLVVSSQGNPVLGADPFVIHYLPPGASPIAIEDVRTSLLPLGTVSVQVLGDPRERRFMIRMEDREFEDRGGVPAEKIIATLEASFGEGGVAVTRSDYVGSRFSKQLAGQAGYLMFLTLVIILIYASVRFKPQYAIGAVLAIVHDALIMVAFVVWTRMEFNTTTIAAILTILGYSINDTIVIFDRIRETRRIFPDDTMTEVLDRSITETLSRTIITTFTTMLAVMFLYVFTTGSMKDFALALLVGMTSGVYSTIFIAGAFVNLWDLRAAARREKRKAAGTALAKA
ncbi:MAG: protein translocase subunit SecF [Treponema sp.]|jgi:preprotein translocase subunit SecF|nr:protein translocase subunit SecF [Treponema sp.]